MGGETMATLKAGARLKSAVCDTQVMVIAVPAGDVALTCGDVLLLGNDRLIAVHGKENIDSTSKGRLVCLKIPTEYPAAGTEQIVLGPEAELWRNDEHVAFSSSPTLVDGRVYTTIATGSLLCTDAETGVTLWRKKLAPDQLHSSPGYADGKLYIPMLDGTVHVIKPDASGGTVVSVNELGAPCLGAPAFYEDEVFIFTKEARAHRRRRRLPGISPP
jgi:outer membrane protein assembly factor BamB